MKTLLKIGYLVIVIALTFIACKKDEVKAEESLEGEWKIVSINSEYGTFTQSQFGSSFDPFDEVSENGDLGFFEFIESTVDFEFTRNDTMYTGNESWNLDLERVNVGFTRVNEYTLTIENQFLFDVAFGDETKNSEKNATSITFLETPSENGYGVRIQMELEKNE